MNGTVASHCFGPCHANGHACNLPLRWPPSQPIEEPTESATKGNPEPALSNTFWYPEMKLLLQDPWWEDWQQQDDDAFVSDLWAGLSVCEDLRPGWASQGDTHQRPIAAMSTLVELNRSCKRSQWEDNFLRVGVPLSLHIPMPSTFDASLSQVATLGLASAIHPKDAPSIHASFA